jgi:acetyl/propionyl-CoA carboxylase alpha subunit
MIKRLLIANRGEIVCRIIKACRQMGIESVAVFSDVDKGAYFVRQADSAINIGPGNPMKSYLNVQAIIEAGKQAGADAVHPGYGFLSESFSLAEAAMANGMAWVGPPPQVLKALESKCYCRQVADRVDVPVNPGTLKPIQGVEDVHAFAAEYGYPLFIKLDKGGGGKGIEMVGGPDQLQAVLERISRIGQVAFGSTEVYIEKVLRDPRHIEVQFLADGLGHCVCLGERECSIQRRHQKIIEESPSPIVTEKDRKTLFQFTTRLVQAMGYQGAGTIEFLRSNRGVYSFMEINARLQVEHPVTEFLTGVDIVKAQIDIASGKAMELHQGDIKMKGHAIEARVYAEDPLTFHPSPGTIAKLRLPPETSYLRIDHALEEKGVVPPYYDPLLAKVISWGVNRRESRERLIEALGRFEIEGIRTTIPSNLSILKSREFQEGQVDTGFIQRLFLEEGR